MVLNMHTSLYEQSEAPHMWCEKPKSGLETRGFKKSNVVACLYILDKLILV